MCTHWLGIKLRGLFRVQKDSKVRFEEARRFYDIAIQMLVEKFDYNPSFKRPGDQI